ncbi:MAG TPA: LacI family DNA-binding transcriptional regulator [Tepidisphaeraceae bacterium]|jgi:LacI family transcriptional regulator|nr:LacI family DNA-binding transcriptional regulator [Tepidisphaeraceae bacterium]
MASINEVAALAKVSVSTVSRVMNNQPRVAPETMQAVRDAMAKLNYAPSERRPGPKPQRNGSGAMPTIGFLVFGTSEARATPAFEGLLYGVSLAASQANLNLVFSHVPDPTRLPARIAEQGINGVLLHGAAPSQAICDRLSRLPTVWLMGNRHRPTFGDKVMPDSYVVGEVAARYLLKRGHRKLAFLNVNAGHWPFKVSAHAFNMTAAEGGGEVQVVERAVSEESGAYWRTHDPEVIRSVVQQYLALPDRPTGLFVADDMQAALLQPELQAQGVVIGPGGVEVISCNDEQPYLAGLAPKPATIDIQVAAIGRKGVEQLVWRMANPDAPERITCMVEPSLVPAPAASPTDPTAKHGRTRSAMAGMA